MVAMISYFPTVAATLAHEIKTQVKGVVTIGLSGGEGIAVIDPQPVKSNELMLLEPGERLHNYRVTWTQALVIPTDEISIGGKKYRVHQVDDRGEFYRVVMREKVTNVA